MNGRKKTRAYALFTAVVVAVSLIIPQTAVFAAAPSYNYGEALQKSILFYEFQRSGDLPEDKRDNWRADSAMTDGQDVGLDLTGGWYDAGDHVKFNLPMSYTASTLAWSVYEDRDAYVQSGQLKYIMDAIKWANDYFIKCHPSPNEYYYQVGSGSDDHRWWGAAEVMLGKSQSGTQMTRPSYKATMSSPASAVVAGTAASLAACATIFKDTDPAYAEECISHAKELLEFADATRSDSGYTAATGFYQSWSGYWDELSWASVWIYLATGDEAYLERAESYVPNWEREQQTTTIKYKWTHCWDTVQVGTQLLLARITGKSLYKESMERNLDYWTVGYNGEKVRYTPKGLAWLDQWGSLRYATTAAFVADVYADWSGCTPEKVRTYKDFAKKQVDYCLGDTGRSFVVGFGTTPPEHPHHRTAHGSWCDNWQTPIPENHSHVLYGALVGGPRTTDDSSYTDDIGDYICNEVACDYNAGFTGILARMYKEYGGEPIPGFKAIEEKTREEFFVEACVNSSGPNYIEIKAYMNNRSAWPAKIGDKLSFKYFIDISELLDAGITADQITTKSNYNMGATVSELLPWDVSNNIYYVNVDFTGTDIYPGGQSEFRKEVQFRISGPQDTKVWDNSNDPSYQALPDPFPRELDTAYIAINIPVYDNGQHIFGNEPGGSVKTQTILTPVYPDGQTRFDISGRNTEIKVRLTDGAGNALTGKTIKWSSSDSVNIASAESVTDASGIATVTANAVAPSDSGYTTVIIDEAVTASFAGDQSYLVSGCDVNVYAEIAGDIELGDVNSDGSINSMDYALLKRYLIDDTTEINTFAADMDSSGQINSLDLVLLKKKLLE